MFFIHQIIHEKFRITHNFNIVCVQPFLRLLSCFFVIPLKGNWGADAADLCIRFQDGLDLWPPRPLLCSHTDSVAVWQHRCQKPPGNVKQAQMQCSTSWSIHGDNELFLRNLVLALIQQMDTWYRTMFQDMGDASAKHAQSVRSMREEIAAYRKDVSGIIINF